MRFEDDKYTNVMTLIISWDSASYFPVVFSSKTLLELTF